MVLPSPRLGLPVLDALCLIENDDVGPERAVDVGSVDDNLLVVHHCEELGAAILCEPRVTRRRSGRRPEQARHRIATARQEQLGARRPGLLRRRKCVHATQPQPGQHAFDVLAGPETVDPMVSATTGVQGTGGGNYEVEIRSLDQPDGTRKLPK